MMVEIKGKILTTYVSILINPSACRSYVAPKIADLCKLGIVKNVKPWLVVGTVSHWYEMKDFKSC